MDLRAKLLQKGAVPKDTVEVVLEGETIRVEVRGLSAAQRGRMMTLSMAQVTGDDGETTEKPDLEKISPELVIACAFDPDTGKQIFSEADRDAVGGLAATFLDPIFTRASQLSGLSTATAASAEGNSGKTTA